MVFLPLCSLTPWSHGLMEKPGLPSVAGIPAAHAEKCRDGVAAWAPEDVRESLSCPKHVAALHSSGRDGARSEAAPTNEPRGKPMPRSLVQHGRGLREGSRQGTGQLPEAPVSLPHRRRPRTGSQDAQLERHADVLAGRTAHGSSASTSSTRDSQCAAMTIAAAAAAVKWRRQTACSPASSERRG